MVCWRLSDIRTFDTTHYGDSGYTTHCTPPPRMASICIRCQARQRRSERTMALHGGPSTRRTVLISGGGIAGLTLAY